MIALKVSLLIVFASSWVFSKKSRLLEPSDFFVPSFLVIYAPGFLFNPSGHTDLNGLSLPDAAIWNSELGFMLALLAGTLGFGIRFIVEQRMPWITESVQSLSSPPPRVIAFAAAAISFCLFVLLLQSTEFRDYRLSVARFFTFDLSSGEYRVLRNLGYADSTLLEGLMGRLQFTLFPVCFCLIIYPLLDRRRVFAAIVVAVTYFLLLPASLSKMPALFFLGYFLLLVLIRLRIELDITRLFVLTIFASAALVLFLVLLYLSQYQGQISNGYLDPVKLAIERLWGEPFSIVVRYFAVYSEMLPFTGWSGINLLAQAIGLSPRLPHLEVARALIGPDSGSNPSVFFMAGYAAFGFVGLGVFSLLGILLLWILDIVGRKISIEPIRATYFAVIGMNAMFLNQIALQTSLVTYGLAVVPPGLLLLDRLLARCYVDVT
jgi:hypothetical protein